jgi:hypothetical protein
MPNSTTVNNIVVWHNATGTSLGESSVSVASQNMANLNSISLNEVAINPSTDDTIWIDSTTGQLILGSQNIHEIGGDISRPATSTDNVVAYWDGTIGGLMQDSNMLIDDSSNTSRAKSVTFTSSALNPGAGRTVWYNARTTTLRIGNNELADLAIAQMLSNKTLTAPFISTISNTGTITLPTTTTTLAGPDTTDTLTNKTMTRSINLVNASTLLAPLSRSLWRLHQL